MKTHCLRGHLRSPENVENNRTCKECQKERYSALRALRASQRPPKTHCKNGHPKTCPGRCKECELERSRKYRKAHPEVGREKSLRWKERNPEKRKISAKKQNLKRTGWTPEMVRVAIEAQGNLCGICREPMKKPCADHKHGDIPKPREVLCSTCNVMLGQAQENPSILRAGAEYLEKWSFLNTL
jgi:hypothetical protein